MVMSNALSSSLRRETERWDGTHSIALAGLRILAAQIKKKNGKIVCRTDRIGFVQIEQFKSRPKKDVL